MKNEKKPTGQQFTIEGVTPKIGADGKARVLVSVSYPGGAHIFDFPAHYTPQSILAQVRLQLRQSLAANADKYESLLGKKHDL